jgi:hypothetical protein
MAGCVNDGKGFGLWHIDKPFDKRIMNVPAAKQVMQGFKIMNTAIGDLFGDLLKHKVCRFDCSRGLFREHDTQPMIFVLDVRNGVLAEQPNRRHCGEDQPNCQDGRGLYQSPTARDRIHDFG